MTELDNAMVYIGEQIAIRYIEPRPLAIIMGAYSPETVAAVQTNLKAAGWYTTLVNNILTIQLTSTRR